MNLVQTVPLALRALNRNKARSLLTTLGVVIGVASVDFYGRGRRRGERPGERHLFDDGH